MSKDFADHSSLSHFSKAATAASVGGVVVVTPSIPVTLTGSADGREPVPSKWLQNPFASTASSNRTEKMAQLRPLASSFGIEDGNESDSEVVVTDMAGKFQYEYLFDFKHSGQGP